jgi:hypothetical protein
MSLCICSQANDTVARGKSGQDSGVSKMNPCFPASVLEVVLVSRANEPKTSKFYITASQSVDKPVDHVIQHEIYI